MAVQDEIEGLDEKFSTSLQDEDVQRLLMRKMIELPSFISIPLVQSSESIEIALQTIELDRACAYDSFRGEWKSYVRSKPYKGTLNTINHTMGLWINVTGQSNLTVVGAVPMHTVIHLQKGWNLVGFPSLDSTYTVADLKASVPVERVEAFDASARRIS